MVGSESYDEDEVGTLSELGAAYDVTVEHFSDLFRDVEAEANAFGVDLLAGFEEAEELEEFGHVFLLDADAGVLDGHFEVGRGR